MRIVFMGTPEFSTATLKALIDAGHDIVCVYTQPPRPAGRRGLELKPSPVHALADKHSIEVRTPISLKSEEEQSRFDALDADVAIVVAYGLLLPKPILDSPKHGCFNGHASLLPRWRGAAPIQRAIMAGDDVTGMMIMKMDVGLDTGPYALSEKVDITDDTTAGSLHDQLMDISGPLAVKAMELLETNEIELIEQKEEGITYAAKIDKAECRINFEKSAKDVHRHIMGLSPFLGAWFELGEGKKAVRVKVLRSKIVDSIDSSLVGQVIDDKLTIACADGAIQLIELQKAGGKKMDAQSFLRGVTIDAGTKLT
ncbi:methionyl-tRNA formyltransferase [Lentilitoribacter sp. EG35]|uniref:methionyl-tRNA formyltransferase n=1 Tax=Lentilitoribacter sp. EG35 TaxID=3234192 RepID=UPI0034617556